MHISAMSWEHLGHPPLPPQALLKLGDTDSEKGSVRSGLSLAGWKPRQNKAQQAVEWWEFDCKYFEHLLLVLVVLTPRSV